MSALQPHWLRHQLLLRLMLPLLAIVALAGVVGAYTAQDLTDRVFDRWLLDAARSLAKQIHFVDHRAQLELPPVAEAMLVFDENDRVLFSVDQDGRHLLGQPGLPTEGQRTTHYHDGRAFDAEHAGRAVRVVAVDVWDQAGAHATVWMAETTNKRHRTELELMTMLLPMAALLLAAAVAIGLAVQRTLRPLQAIAERWNERSHVSLEAIDAQDVPRELLPFASALNDLLARIRAMLTRERQFAASVAHQLRTPLAGIRLGLARAAEAPDLPTARRVLGELDRSTQRTARLVQQLLALARLNPEARGNLDFVATDLGALAHDVGMAYMEQALERHIDLEFRAPPQAVRVIAQPDLLSEALGNLLDNALRYTPDGGRALISLHADPPCLRVEDSGPGVPAEEREIVFKRLVRGSGAVGEGSGLGLSIVRDIATLHDATVSLQASPLGGARFELCFRAPAPLQAAPGDVAADRMSEPNVRVTTKRSEVGGRL